MFDAIDATLDQVQQRLPDITAKITALLIEEITGSKIAITYHPDGVMMMGHNGSLGILTMSFPVLGAVAAHIAGMFLTAVPSIPAAEYEKLLLESFREIAKKRGGSGLSPVTKA